ncbi:MAG: AzlD domain-containing protein [Agathobacter sp.]|uniref:AzlD domain-containing protein n=1 Tax=Agathobacter sp. TaxID=2021311 RepID=UPI003991AFE6
MSINISLLYKCYQILSESRLLPYETFLVNYTAKIPEFISVVVTGALHIWKRQMLLSIAGGTICYMLLIHMI